jgi:beta-glucanase (GH16 family)
MGFVTRRAARRWAIVALLLAGLAPALAAEPAPPAAGLGAVNAAVDAPMTAPRTRPTFADEFGGPAVDRRVWRFDTARNAAGWHNNELQYYADGRPENARIEDGVLVITARRERLSRASDWGGQAYTSARLVSTAAYGYGFYEVRARLPCGRGAWPAIWLLPSGGKWPDAGEIDIMEMVGWDPNVVHGTVHSAAYNHRLGTQRGARVRVPTSCTAFHRYQLDWRPESITVGVDDRAYFRIANDRPGDAAAWPFVRPYHLILNLAVGGDWGGQKGVDDSAFPQRMTVDYVRHWASGG